MWLLIHAGIKVKLHIRPQLNHVSKRDHSCYSCFYYNHADPQATYDDFSTHLTNRTNTLQWRHNGNDGVSNHQPHGCLLNRLFGRRSKKTSKLRVTGLCAGNSPGTGEFPAQMASNAENVSIWWRHHEECLWWTSRTFSILTEVSFMGFTWCNNPDKGNGGNTTIWISEHSRLSFLQTFTHIAGVNTFVLQAKQVIKGTSCS